MKETPEARLAAILTIVHAALANFGKDMAMGVQLDLKAIEQLADAAAWPEDCSLCGKPLSHEHNAMSIAEHRAQNPHAVRVVAGKGELTVLSYWPPKDGQ